MSSNERTGSFHAHLYCLTGACPRRGLDGARLFRCGRRRGKHQRPDQRLLRSRADRRREAGDRTRRRPSRPTTASRRSLPRRSQDVIPDAAVPAPTAGKFRQPCRSRRTKPRPSSRLQEERAGDQARTSTIACRPGARRRRCRNRNGPRAAARRSATSPRRTEQAGLESGGAGFRAAPPNADRDAFRRDPMTRPMLRPATRRAAACLTAGLLLTVPALACTDVRLIAADGTRLHGAHHGVCRRSPERGRDHAARALIHLARP